MPCRSDCVGINDDAKDILGVINFLGRGCLPTREVFFFGLR
jgi:hypothetical protein